MNYKKGRQLFQIMALIAAACFVIALLFQIIWLVVIGLVIAALAALEAHLFYRCPYCHSPISTRVKDPKECPSCGRELQ